MIWSKQEQPSPALPLTTLVALALALASSSTRPECVWGGQAEASGRKTASLQGEECSSSHLERIQPEAPEAASKWAKRQRPSLTLGLREGEGQEKEEEAGRRRHFGERGGGGGRWR